MVIKRLNLVVSRIDIDRQELRREYVDVFLDESNRDVAELDSEARVYKPVVGVLVILHVELLDSRDVILVVPGICIVNLDIDEEPFVPTVNDAVVETCIRQVDIDFIQSKFGLVELRLLGNDLLNNPADGARVRLEAVGQDFGISDPERWQGYPQRGARCP